MGFVQHLIVFIVTTFTIKSCTSLWTKQTDNPESLVLLHVLFRHGDRTPEFEEIYPNDPYAEIFPGVLGYGKLTHKGELREYLIGKALRIMYKKFLGDCTEGAVEARSTDYDRTKKSCQLVLSSLYRSNKKTYDSKLHSDSCSQPISCHYEDYSRDQLMGDPRDNNPRYIKLYNDYLNSSEGLALRAANEDFYKYLSNKSGRTINRPREVYDLYFGLKSEENLKLKLPQWTESVWPELITRGAVQEYDVSTATTELKRLSGGFLMKKIINDTKAKIEGAENLKNRKLFLYSGHENNIAYLLKLLDVFHLHVPPFGAYLILEVRNLSQTYGFKIYYQDYSKSVHPKLLKLPGCDEFCPLDQFVNLVEQYLPHGTGA